MTPEENELDHALEQIRSEQIDDTVLATAAARVWNRLHAPLRSCADFRALFAEYRAGSLPESRALLVKDHLHECVACRRAYEGPRRVLEMPSRKMAPSIRWAVAAAVMVAAGLGLWGVYLQIGSGGRTVIQAASGAVYHVSGDSLQKVAPGAELSGRGEIRTARDSGAVVRLRDGSMVEMRERSALSVTEAGRDLTVRLTRGSIIVQAAKRRFGHLFVATRDCRVAVTGTVFSVSSGIKGSRVSVVEGQVKVSQGKQEKVLRPGDQYSSDPSVTAVPVRDDIAWSRNREQHLALLKEFSALEKDLHQVRLPDLRYSSRIFDMLPADTALYLAIPNLAQSFTEAGRMLEQRAQESEVLRQWLQSRRLQEFLDKLRTAGEYFGDEIVVAVPAGRGPVFLAEVKRSGFREYLEGELARMGAPRGALRVVEDPAGLQMADGEVALYMGPGLAAVSPDGAAMAALGQSLKSGRGGFAGTELGQRVAEAYRGGAGLVLAADLRQFIRTPPAGHHEDHPGFENMKYAVLEHKEGAGRSDTRAVLGFTGPRQGIAAWLSRPAPITALEYVSPDATLVSAFALKSPAALLDELAGSQGMRKDLNEAEAGTGIDVRRDLAAPLGGEFAFAMDGPALPVPAWKLAVEVYDANRLQWTIERLVEWYNRNAAGHGRAPVELSQEAANGRTWHRLVIPGLSKFAEVNYLFTDGYLLAAPSRGLVERAMQYRDSGFTLTRSARFTAMLPRDGYTDFSGLYYQDVGSALGPLMESLRSALPGRRGLPEMASEFAKPMLITFYGEEDRIALASNGLPLGMSPASLLRMTSQFSLLPGLGGHGRRPRR